MASEQLRGCGYRKVGGMYLVGGYINVPCDRLPLHLESCPVCGAGIHFTRSMTEVNPYRLFGNHDKVVSDQPGESHLVLICKDQIRPCHICDPPNDVAFLMMVGGKYYTPESFMVEAGKMGVSKKIPFIPKRLKLGITIVYLAHPKACVAKQAPVLQEAMAIVEANDNTQPRLVDAEKEESVLGIFCAFIPQRIEKLHWQSELDAMSPEDKETLAKRGITPVGIPDGDEDHA